MITQMSNPTMKVLPVGDRELRVERVFAAKRERVWRAFTDPDQLAQWWGRGNKVVIERFELVRGGHWRFVEHSEGGAFGFEGRFREIVPIERLSQTFEFDGAPGDVVVNTTTLEDLGNGQTRVVTVSKFFDASIREAMVKSGMEGGMKQSYAALDKLLAQQPN